MEKKEVAKIAELARIGLSEEEYAQYAEEIEHILEYVAQVREVSGGTAEHRAGVLRNVMREDGAPHDPGAHSKALLNEAPRTKDGYVQVKQILSLKTIRNDD